MTIEYGMSICTYHIPILTSNVLNKYMHTYIGFTSDSLCITSQANSSQNGLKPMVPKVGDIAPWE